MGPKSTSAALIILLALTATGWVFAGYFWLSRPIPEPEGAVHALIRAVTGPHSASLEYKDFISILLTAIGVLLTALALIIGIAAVWGYAGLKEMTLAAATKTASETAANVAREVATEISARTSATMSEAGWDEPRTQTDDNYGKAARREDGNGRTGGSSAD